MINGGSTIYFVIDFCSLYIYIYTVIPSLYSTMGQLRRSSSLTRVFYMQLVIL